MSFLKALPSPHGVYVLFPPTRVYIINRIYYFRPLTGFMFFFQSVIVNIAGYGINFRPLTGFMFFFRCFSGLKKKKMLSFRPLTGFMFFFLVIVTSNTLYLNNLPSPHGVYVLFPVLQGIGREKGRYASVPSRGLCSFSNRYHFQIPKNPIQLPSPHGVYVLFPAKKNIMNHAAYTSVPSRGLCSFSHIIISAI